MDFPAEDQISGMAHHAILGPQPFHNRLVFAKKDLEYLDVAKACLHGSQHIRYLVRGRQDRTQNPSRVEKLVHLLDVQPRLPNIYKCSIK